MPVCFLTYPLLAIFCCLFFSRETRYEILRARLIAEMHALHLLMRFKKIDLFPGRLHRLLSKNCIWNLVSLSLLHLTIFLWSVPKRCLKAREHFGTVKTHLTSLKTKFPAEQYYRFVRQVASCITLSKRRQEKNLCGLNDCLDLGDNPT